MKKKYHVNVLNKRSLNLSFVIASISAALISYEILLTRYFSVIMSHSYVYLIVSIALLFSGIGAFVTYKKFKVIDEIKINNFITKRTLNLVVSIVTFISLGMFMPYINSPLLYALASGTSFYLGGQVFSAIYLIQRRQTHLMYFSDLLGAAIGSSIFLLVLYKGSFYSGLSVILFYLTLALFSLKTKENNKSMGIFICLTLFISILVALPSINQVIDNNFVTYRTSPNTAIAHLSTQSNKDVKIIYSKWRGFSRTDVITYGNDQKRYILTDGGAAAPMYKFNGDLNTISDMKQDISYLPHLLKKDANTLLIGSGGGVDVLYAKLADAKKITAVEINKNTVEAVKKFASYNGDIYNKDSVDLKIMDGRNFIDKTTELYDQIYLSLVMSNAIDSSKMSLVENYIFTSEAFESYYDGINEEGMISFITHDINEAFRVTNTWIQTLVKKGVPYNAMSDYFMVINGMPSHGGAETVRFPLIILKKSPMTYKELEVTSKFLNDNNYSVLQLPGYDAPYYEILKSENMNVNDMYKQSQANLKPVNDNNPYFYKFNSRVDTELIPLMALIVLFMTYLLATMWKNKIPLKSVQYFTFIGIGYIMIELGMMQLLNRYLEISVLSFAIVIISILMGSSFGSYLIWKKLNINITRVTLLLFVMTLLVMLSVKYIVIETAHYNLPIKLLIIFPVLFSLGLLMGMPFPYYLNKLSLTNEESLTIPYMYAVNGLAILTGSVMTVVLSSQMGYLSVLVTAATAYLIAGFAIKGGQSF